MTALHSRASMFAAMPKGKTYERVRFQGDVLKDPYFWK